MENMYQFACRNKLRFPYKGQISVEDLWDLPVEQLDNIYRLVNAELKAQQTDSLLASTSVAATRSATLDTYRVAILKDIVETKLAEKAAAEKAAETRQKKQRILEIIATKQDSELQNKSIEDLKKELDDL